MEVSAYYGSSSSLKSGYSSDNVSGGLRWGCSEGATPVGHGLLPLQSRQRTCRSPAASGSCCAQDNDLVIRDAKSRFSKTSHEPQTPQPCPDSPQCPAAMFLNKSKRKVRIFADQDGGDVLGGVGPAGPWDSPTPFSACQAAVHCQRWHNNRT